MTGIDESTPAPAQMHRNYAMLRLTHPYRSQFLSQNRKYLGLLTSQLGIFEPLRQTWCTQKCMQDLPRLDLSGAPPGRGPSAVLWYRVALPIGAVKHMPTAVLVSF